jgi:hypothetical protein
MNEENKEILNNSTPEETKPETPVEMPAVAPAQAPAEPSAPVAPVQESTEPSAPAAPTNPLDQTVETKRVIPTPVAGTPASTPATPAASSEAPQKEVGTVVVGNPMSNVVKPIPVGDIQGSGPVATVGGGTTPAAPKGKSNIVSVIILVVAIIVLIGLVLFKYVFKGNINLAGGLTGTVQNGELIYKGAKKGDKINFKVTDNLKLVLSIDEVDVQTGVGTKITASLKEADGSDSISLTNLWLEDDNETLKVGIKKIGEYAVISDSVLNSDLVVIASDGKVSKFNDMASFVNEEKGLVISFSTVSDEDIQVEASRKLNMGSITYGDIVTEMDLSSIGDNEEELNKYSRYNIGEGFNICVDDTSKIPESTTVTAIFTFKLKDGKLDLSNPEISDKVDFKTYVEQDKEFECAA